MAGCAPQVLEVEDGDSGARYGFVAVVAGYGKVTAGQGEAGSLVQRQRHGVGFEGEAGMALFAVVVPGRAGKLPLMRILVTVDAEGEADPETRLFACRDMAIGALDLIVGSGKRESGLCVACDGEGRGGEALHGMAAFAASAVGARQKLAAVRILVAIGTGCMRERRFKVASAVATDAGHREMLSDEGIVCLGVIEGVFEARPLPVGGAVARVAALFEFAFVRIGVAGAAGCEGNARPARLARGVRGMTFLAGSIAMLSGEGKLRLRVVEATGIEVGRLPSGG